MKLGKLLKIAPCEICLYVSTSNDIFDDDYTDFSGGMILAKYDRDNA